MKVDYRKLYGDSELLDTFLNQSAGEVLKELRKERKLSLAEVESRTEMFSKQTLSKYELGKSKLRMNMFFELARIYNINPKDLYDKIHGAWLGRICGCMLGKSIEGIHTDELIPFLKETDNGVDTNV